MMRVKRVTFQKCWAAVLAATVAALPAIGLAAIEGTVYVDYNANGTKDTSGANGTAIDVGLGAVVVSSFGVTGAGTDGVVGTADDVLGACGASVTTSSTPGVTLGTYQLTTAGCLAGSKIRVTFTSIPAPYQSGHSGRTSIQFVDDGATGVDLPLINPTQFCENNPLLAYPCYQLGNQTGNPIGVVKTSPYGAGGTTLATAQTPAPGSIAQAQQVGTTYGTAYQQQTKRLFSAAYQKNGYGYGPSGPGAIYATDVTGATAPVTWINITTLANDPARPGLFGPGSAGTDPFGSSANSLAATNQMSWGDADVSADQATLYAMNMTNLRIYAMPATGSPITSNASVTVLPTLPFPASDAGCTAARAYDLTAGLQGPQAFGLAVRGNSLYAGARCKPVFGQSNFYVFRYDISAGTWDSTPAFSAPVTALNYSPSEANGQISDIEFAPNGDMILAIRNIYPDAIDPGTGASVGQLLRACQSGGTGPYILESNGSCGGTAGAGVGNTNGPGGGQFFSPDIAADGQSHSQNGGFVRLPGSNVGVSTSYDSFELYELNLSWWNLDTGVNIKEYRVLKNGGPSLPADAYNVKQGLLGDIELLCSAAPVEIGNRVWRDLNKNGIQDPNEPAIAGVTVELKNGSTVIGTAVTDANGLYVFSNDKRGYPASGNDGTAAGGYVDNGQGGTTSTAAFRYGLAFVSGDALTVSIPNGQAPLSGLALTTANAGADAALDSNFALNSGVATASVTVGAPGANNYSIDAGYVVPNIDLTIAKTLVTSGVIQPGNAVQYSIVATNLGPSAAQERIVVKDCVPANLTAATATGTGWTCSTGASATFGSLSCSSVITCTRDAGTGAIAANSPASTITVNATVAAAATGAIRNYAQVNPASNETVAETNLLGTNNGGYETGDPAIDSNNDASVEFTVTPLPTIDLTVAKSVTNAGPYVAGGSVTYSLVARNLGPGTAQERIVVKDCIPTGLTSAVASGSEWTCSTGAAQTFGSLQCSAVITCTRNAATGNLGSNIPAGAISVSATVGAGVTGLLKNYALVTPAAGETLLESNVLGTVNGGYETGDAATDSNNDASATITAVAPQTIDLTIAKSITSAAPYVSGNAVAYSLVARNLGPGTAQEAIVVKDCVPTGLTGATASGSQWTCSTGAGGTFGSLTCSAVITCTRNAGTGTLAQNVAAGAIAVNATIGSGVTGVLTNYVQVNPAAGETLLESNLLGTANGGYETGDAAAGSNNDASAAISVGAAPTTITVSKAYTGDTTRITTQPSITAQAVCTISGTRSTTFTPPSTGSITGLVVGESCTVSETNATGAVLSGGYTLSAPGVATVTPAATFTTGATNAVTVTNTVIPPDTYAIGNRVWLDSNNNGVLDSGELGLIGISVRLINVTTNAVVSTTNTTSGGCYAFQGLLAGTYAVEIVPPVGYVSSTGLNGSATGPFEPGVNGTALSDDDRDHGTTQAGGNIRSGNVVLGAGLQPLGESTCSGGPALTTPDDRTNLTVDFGLFVPAKLGNLVWIDNGAGGGTANDGVRNGGEVGLNGVTVRVLNGSGAVVASTTTANNPGTGAPGWYEVTNLVPGQYQVEFAQPVGYAFTTRGAAAIVSGSGPDTAFSQVTSANPRTALITLSAGDNNPQLDAGVVVAAAPPTPNQPIPTLSQWALVLLGLLMVGLAAHPVARATARKRQ